MIHDITGYNLISSANSNTGEYTYLPLSPSFKLNINSLDELCSVMDCMNDIQFQLHIDTRYALSFQLFEYIVHYIDVPYRYPYFKELYSDGWFSTYNKFLNKLSLWIDIIENNDILIYELNRLKLLGNSNGFK